MREIKFRAWSEPLKKMDYSPLNTISFDGKQIFYGSGEITGFFDSIMQYTGLKDKNGREIYEGDIIHYCITDWIDGYPVEREEKREVSYSVGCFWLIDNKGDDVLFLIHDDDDEMEIIGNVYQNPELLAGDSK